jgi:ADP-dependent NAD(P)H-hydrate dehydratase / NAD(P)H-hydrate epimerase
MKIYTSSQIREIDKYTIENEPITSIDLMERAAIELYKSISTDLIWINQKLIIFCGIGNNGGDGLALGRFFMENDYDVVTVLCKFSDNISSDCKTNLERLQNIENANLLILEDTSNLPNLEDRIIIDCLFGTGLTRKVEGKFEDIINYINSSGNTVFSVDIPSGLFGEDNSTNDGAIIKAKATYTLAYTPLAYFFASTNKYFGHLNVLDIGLLAEAESKITTPYFNIERDDVLKLRRYRSRFGHKGIYGHSLLISGSYTKAGAAILCAKACMRGGTGLLTVHVPSKLVDVLQISVPEAMISLDENQTCFSGISDFDKYSAVGIGPGLGTDEKTVAAFTEFAKNCKNPLVIDADGLNILAMQPELISVLKPSTILTPHPKEFERLFGKFESEYHCIEFMRDFSQRTGIIIVRKDGITAISSGEGQVYFNDAGNPGMATGGSGDVLTGLILSLLAQGYEPDRAANMGVYIHSTAGDLAYRKKDAEGLIASDIINYIPKAFKQLRPRFWK